MLTNPVRCFLFRQPFSFPEMNSSAQAPNAGTPWAPHSLPPRHELVGEGADLAVDRPRVTRPATASASNCKGLGSQSRFRLS